MSEQPTLKFLGHEVSRVVFERPLDFIHGEFEIKFEHLNHVNQDQINEFSAEMIVTIQSVDEKFNLQVQFYGHFEINGNASDSVLENFHYISAPTIIYPFIRAFVSNLTIQTGMNPIFIPTINFGSRYQDKKRESQED
jgi:preprotein translocase subunit SecB